MATLRHMREPMTTDVVVPFAPDVRHDSEPVPADPTPLRALRAVGPGIRDADTIDASLAVVAADLAATRTPEVTAADAWAEAGRKVLRFHLIRMLARIPGTIDGQDPEEVHGMRVAARRVRAAWRVFGDAYERPIVREQVTELRALGGRLGAVRDLDVQLGILAAHRDGRSKRERAALTPLVEAWTEERAARHRELVDRLASPWFRGFVADQVSLVTTDGAGARPVAAHAASTVRTRTSAVVWEAYQVVWAFEDGLADADVATLHELRIAAKWLRYTLEFVREPLEPAATELIRRVVVLQDQLGDIHDLHAAADLARAFGASPSADLRPVSRKAIERFATTEDVRVDRIRRHLGPAWRGVADAEYRRSLGRALARL
jgi:CHAD domain-containing protein